MVGCTHGAPRSPSPAGGVQPRSMSHHFDTQLATRDPRLNAADAYLFDAAPDRTVMVMTCSADAALSACSRRCRHRALVSRDVPDVFTCAASTSGPQGISAYEPAMPPAWGIEVPTP